ncbi:hypothetical protein ABBQ38_000868 [Trebouxia sp. C0009 RCD-2024]
MASPTCSETAGKSWVAKVVATTYPWQLHQQLSKLGLAPKLTGPLEKYPGGVAVIQMEYLDPADGWTPLDRFTGDWDSLQDVALDALELLQTCCDGKAVHGDLNPNNLFVRLPKLGPGVDFPETPELKFLDLAWGGLEGQVTYPPFVNSKAVLTVPDPDAQAVESQFRRIDLFNAHPKSLQFDRGTDEPKPEVATSRLRQALLTISGFYSKESQLLRGSKNLYQAVVQQAANKQLYEVFKLERKFASEYNMLCLHMWMLLVRLRSEGKDGKALAQMVYELFQENVEARVRAEGVKVRLNKWLNELEQMFYGMSFAFDKSLSGDEDITGALLRNFYNDDKSKQKAADILARYTTRELACLVKTESEHVMSGQIRFSDDLFSH